MFNYKFHQFFFVKNDAQYEEEVTVMGLNTVIPQFIRHKNVAI